MAMSGHHDPPAPPSASVSDLISHYRAQKDAWREWENQLERLHNQILSAAERQAATIVTTARADILRILVEARRELFVLTSKVRAVTDPQEGPDARADAASRPSAEASGEDGQGDAVPAMAGGDTQDRLLSARHEIRRLLDEARPMLERLSEEAQVPGQRPQSTPTDEQARSSPPQSPVPAQPSSPAEVDRFVVASDGSPEAAPLEVGPPDDVRTEDASFNSGEEKHGLSRRGMVALGSVVGTAILVGLAWWLRPGPVSAERGTPQAATAPAPELPSQAAAAPEGPAPSAPAPEAPPPAAPPVVETPPPSAGAAPLFLSILVEARREAWIQSTIDGKADAGRLYPAGTTRKIEGARSVLLRVGDAGAVYVSVNGEEARILGQDGRTVTRRYTVDAEPVPPAGPRGQT